jgi:hypothetical protein
MIRYIEIQKDYDKILWYAKNTDCYSIFLLASSGCLHQKI